MASTPRRSRRAAARAVRLTDSRVASSSSERAAQNSSELLDYALSSARAICTGGGGGGDDDAPASDVVCERAATLFQMHRRRSLPAPADPRWHQLLRAVRTARGRDALEYCHYARVTRAMCEHFNSVQSSSADAAAAALAAAAARDPPEAASHSDGSDGGLDSDGRSSTLGATSTPGRVSNAVLAGGAGLRSQIGSGGGGAADAATGSAAAAAAVAAAVAATPSTNGASQAYRLRKKRPIDNPGRESRARCTRDATGRDQTDGASSGSDMAWADDVPFGDFVRHFGLSPIASSPTYTDEKPAPTHTDERKRRKDVLYSSSASSSSYSFSPLPSSSSSASGGDDDDDDDDGDDDDYSPDSADSGTTTRSARQASEQGAGAAAANGVDIAPGVRGLSAELCRTIVEGKIASDLRSKQLEDQLAASRERIAALERQLAQTRADRDNDRAVMDRRADVLAAQLRRMRASVFHSMSTGSGGGGGTASAPAPSEWRSSKFVAASTDDEPPSSTAGLLDVAGDGDSDDDDDDEGRDESSSSSSTNDSESPAAPVPSVADNATTPAVPEWRTRSGTELRPARTQPRPDPDGYPPTEANGTGNASTATPFGASPPCTVTTLDDDDDDDDDDIESVHQVSSECESPRTPTAPRQRVDPDEVATSCTWGLETNSMFGFLGATKVREARYRIYDFRGKRSAEAMTKWSLFNRDAYEFVQWAVDADGMALGNNGWSSEAPSRIVNAAKRHHRRPRCHLTFTVPAWAAANTRPAPEAIGDHTAVSTHYDVRVAFCVDAEAAVGAERAARNGADAVCVVEMPQATTITLNGNRVADVAEDENYSYALLCGYDITRRVRPGTNELTVCIGGGDAFRRRLRVGVFVVRHQSVGAVAERVPRRDAHECVTWYRRVVAARCHGIDECQPRGTGGAAGDAAAAATAAAALGKAGCAVSHKRYSCTDPYSGAVIATPARSMHCTHFQCFDLHTFLEMQRRRPRFECPVCRAPARPRDLYIDVKFAEALRDCSRTGAGAAPVADAAERFCVTTTAGGAFTVSPAVRAPHRDSEAE